MILPWIHGSKDVCSFHLGSRYFAAGGIIDVKLVHW